MTSLLERGPRVRWFVVLVVTVAAYAVTARWYGVVMNDTTAAAWPAWNLVHHGTFYLEGSDPPENEWFVPAQGHLVSNRFPGIVLVGVPAQLLTLPFGAGPLPASTITAVLVTAAAMANLVLLLERLGGTPRQALGCALAFAFGTAAWPVASSELLTHGPDLLWLSLLALAVSRQAWWWAGLAAVPAVLTRPHLVLVPAAVGLWCAFTSRSLRPAYRLGLPCAAALGLLVGWNRLLYGHASFSGGYPDPVGRAQDFSESSVSGSVLTNVAGSLVSPLRGVLVYSPALALGLWCAVVGWRHASGWVRALAVGGVAYGVVQMKLNNFVGGSGFYGNRYWLELLLCQAPLAYLGYLRWARTPARVRAARLLVAASCTLQALGALLAWARPIHEADHDPWTTFLPYDILRFTGWRGVAIVLLVMVWTVVVALRTRPADGAEPDSREVLRSPA